MSDILSILAVPLIAAAIIFLAIFAWGWIASQDTAGTWQDIALSFGNAPLPTSTPSISSSVPFPQIISESRIMNSFPGKLVYTLDTAADPAPYSNHCTIAGGVFNSCGTPCERGAAACVTFCAYTCEF
jgi:hypothetical protein